MMDLMASRRSFESGGLGCEHMCRFPLRGRELRCRYVASGLTWAHQDAAAVGQHVRCVEDGQALRDALPGLGLAAFVGNGSVLPRCVTRRDICSSEHCSLPQCVTRPCNILTTFHHTLAGVLPRCVARPGGTVKCCVHSVHDWTLPLYSSVRMLPGASRRPDPSQSHPIATKLLKRNMVPPC